MKPGTIDKAGSRMSLLKIRAGSEWVSSACLFSVLGVIVCILPHSVFAAGPFEVSPGEHQLDDARALEEAAIQNNPLLRAYYLRRYALIFERTGWESWEYGSDARYGFSLPIRERSRSSHDVFRENFIARQILDFSGKLRELLEELEESKSLLAKINSAGCAVAGNDDTDRRKTEKMLRLTEHIAEISSGIIKHFDGIVPRLNKSSVAVISDETTAEDSNALILRTAEAVDDASREIRNYFYSSRHLVTADDLKSGDLYSGLERVREASLVLNSAIKEEAGAAEPARDIPPKSDALEK